MTRQAGVAIFLLLLATCDLFAEPVGTAFTYQGNLDQAGVPASGTFDFSFELFDVQNGGDALAGPIVSDDIVVDEGRFTVELDFGAGPFDGRQLWLEIGVRDGGAGGGFTSLVPRQKLTAVPYATSGGAALGSFSKAPVAVATLVSQSGRNVQLSARGSFDPEGELLTYAWDFGDGAGDSGLDVGHMYSSDGSSVVTLTVTDTQGLTAVAALKVSYATPNGVPVADAGSEQMVTCGEVVALDGTASADPDGDLLNYHWRFVNIPAGSMVDFNNDGLENPSFEPDLDGTYLIELVVDDGTAQSAGDFTLITCTSL